MVATGGKAMVRWCARLLLPASCAVALSAGLLEAEAGNGHRLSGTRLQAEFGDSSTGLPAANGDRLDHLQWLDSQGRTVADYVASSGRACGDARLFFGQAYGEPEGTAPLAIGPGASASVSDVSDRSLRTSGSTAGCQASADVSAQTDYRTFPGAAGKGDLLRIMRTFQFSATTPRFNGRGLRAYVPALPLGIYRTVLVPNAANTAVNAVDARACSFDCEQVDWNGRWFASDDGQGRGLLLIRDPLSTAAALLNVRSDVAAAVNLSSLVLLQPEAGWNAAVTEIEYLCPYDSLSWPIADRAVGRLPSGCSVDRPAYDFGSATAAAGSSGTSRTLDLDSLAGPSSIAVTNGRYSVNGAAFTAASGTVQPGDALRLQTLAPPASVSAAVTHSFVDIDGRLGVFSVATTDASDGQAGKAAAAPGKAPAAAQTPVTPTFSIADASIVEGNKGSVRLLFTVTLSPAASSRVTVRAETANGTAKSGSDYDGGGPSLSFSPGETSKTVAFTIRGDTLAEPDETFFVDLGSANGGALIGHGRATGTIVNDDVGPDIVPDAFGFSPVSGAAVGSVQTSEAITVSGISAASPISVVGGSYSINNGSYTTSDRTVTAGQTVRIRQTASASFNRTTVASLSIGGVGADYTVTTRAPGLSIGDAKVSEGNGGSSNLVFTVRLSGAASSPVTVAYATADGTALAGSDYVASSGSLSFAAGITSRTLSVAVNGDTGIEPNESLFVNLREPVGATLDDAQGEGTIISDDVATPTLSVADASITEGNTGTKNLAFLVTLSPAATKKVTVRLATANGSASSGSDYNSTSLSLSFAAGETSKSANVVIRGDAATEADETFFVNLSAPTGSAVIGRGQAVGSIVNDDGPITDTVPDGFSFTPTRDAAPGSVQTSNAITVSGINAASPVAVAGGTYSVDNGPFTAGNGSVVAGQSLRVRQTASASAGTSTTATLSIGGVSGAYLVTTVAASDTTPDAFSFASVTGAAPGSEQTSNAITVSGISAAAPITISGGRYSVNDGRYGADPGTVVSGDRVRVRVAAPAAAGATNVARLIIGGVGAEFSVSTAGGGDSTPDPFTLTGPATGFPALAQSSNAVVISGINTAAPVSVVGGTYSRNGAPFTAAAGVVSNGDRLAVQVIAPATVGNSATVTLTVGRVSSSYRLAAEAPTDSIPDPFRFPTLSDVEPGSEQTSAPISLIGNSSPATVTVQGGSYSVNGGPFTTANGTLLAGDLLRMRLLAATNPGSSAEAILTIGGVSGGFEVITRPSASIRPAPFKLVRVQPAGNPISLSYSLPGSVVVTDTVTLSNIQAPVPISITGGTYSLNGRPHTAVAGTAANGDRLTVNMVMPSRFDTVATVVLKVGNFSAALSATTTSDAVSKTPTALNGAETFVYRDTELSAVPLRAFVFKPQGWQAADRRPAFIHFFGGGWVSGEPNSNRMIWAKGQGMVGIAMDYRTNQRFGTTPLESVADARAALRWVQVHAAELGVDPARIVVSGSSVGGHLALWTAIVETPVGSDPASAPLTPPVALSLTSPVSDTAEPFGYRPDRFGMHAAALSPQLQLSARMPPSIIHHGDGDLTVAEATSISLCNRLLAGTNTCEFHNVAGASHSYSEIPNAARDNDAHVAAFLTRLGVLPAIQR